LLERSTAENFSQCYIGILEQVVEDEDIKLSDIRLKHEPVPVETDSISRDEGDFNFSKVSKHD